MSECIVIGGGLIGMLTARELQQAGVDVLLIERGVLGGESSWAGGGIISPLYPWHYQTSVNTLASLSKKIYPSLAEHLKHESGVDCELITSGLLMTDQDEVASTAVEQTTSWAQANGLAINLINDAKALREIEPALNATVDCGLWMPDIMQIRNPKLVTAMRGSFDFHKIAYLENTPVDRPIIRNNRVAGISTAKGEFSADKVIIAGGAWSAGLAAAGVAGLNEANTVNIDPVKGQMVMLKGVSGLVKRIVLANGHYIIPRSDGRILVGSTLEKAGFDKSITTDAQDRLRRHAAESVPVLEKLPVERQWAGLRPGTANGIPYICEHPEVAGLYIHAGHYRNGIVLGPASAQLMVDLVLGRTPCCDPEPYTMSSKH